MSQRIKSLVWNRVTFWRQDSDSSKLDSKVPVSQTLLNKPAPRRHGTSDSDPEITSNILPIIPENSFLRTMPGNYIPVNSGDMKETMCICFGNRLRFWPITLRRRQKTRQQPIPGLMVTRENNESNNTSLRDTAKLQNYFMKPRKICSYSTETGVSRYFSLDNSVTDNSFYSALSRDSYDVAGDQIIEEDFLLTKTPLPRMTKKYCVDSDSCTESTTISGEDNFSTSDHDSSSRDENQKSEPSSGIMSKRALESIDDPMSRFNPEMPLITRMGITPDSYEERLILAKSLIGHWVTILDRSESLDSQYRIVGLGMVKRAVMNRLAIPLTMFLDEQDTVLHCWIHTPLGVRNMRSSLIGQKCTDTDPDAGVWSGTTSVVDYSMPWFRNGQPVRALQQIRLNPKIGKSIETRCVLPDETEGKVMLFNFVMLPKGHENDGRTSANRILRFAGRS